MNRIVGGTHLSLSCKGGKKYDLRPLIGASRSIFLFLGLSWGFSAASRSLAGYSGSINSFTATIMRDGKPFSPRGFYHSLCPDDKRKQLAFHKAATETLEAMSNFSLDQKLFLHPLFVGSRVEHKWMKMNRWRAKNQEKRVKRNGSRKTDQEEQIKRNRQLDKGNQSSCTSSFILYGSRKPWIKRNE